MDTTTYRQMKAYMDDHPIATLSTIDPNGNPSGAIIYICTDPEQPMVYFVTKQETKKYQNLRDRHNVSLTIVSPSENSTLQAEGKAFEIEDATTINMVMEKITLGNISAKDWLPPIAKLHAGAYVIVGVELTHARLAQFKGMAIGDEHIFIR